YYGRPGAWTKMRGSYAIRPFGTPVHLGNAGPSAALDGLKWPEAKECHQWRSDPAQGLPQWLEVDFGRPVTLNTVYLTFDTNIFGRFPSTTPGAEVTAEDYRLLYASGAEAKTEPEWKVAFVEKGNWRRFRRHAFPEVTTSRIRLEILAARNGNEARVYEIRAYHE
ncbi:MAG: discoidin domain-containing protein, partial [Armatimonadota bacterium]|nr:discoidin domain-containing protein [Armatimonadota bacterium]